MENRLSMTNNSNCSVTLKFTVTDNSSGNLLVPYTWPYAFADDQQVVGIV